MRTHTPMTPTQQLLIRTSWTALEPTADDVATAFYTRLFELDPSVRQLFGHTDMDRQRAAFVQMLGVVVRYIDRLEQIVPEVEALGRRHASYGVRSEHYPIVGQALIATLEERLGDALTDEAAYAWAAAYRRLSSVMMAAADVRELEATRRTRRRSSILPLGWQMESTPT
jgi:hemoglobin-like flavoprotein